jgi:hypothetical protein
MREEMRDNYICIYFCSAFNNSVYSTFCNSSVIDLNLRMSPYMHRESLHVGL